MHVNMAGGDAAAFKKGKWSEEEDDRLRAALDEFGIQNWVAIEKFSGLGRPSKNCRLRWFNHLRPNLKKCPFTQEEERIILRLHHRYGNSWSLIASELPGRSDNEIKNYWNKRAKKCEKRQLPLYTPQAQEEQSQGNSPEFKNRNNDSNKTENSTLAHSSISIHSPGLQPSIVPNTKSPSVASATTSIESPHTMVCLSTSKIQCSTNVARRGHVHALQQDGVGYKEFMPLRKPPTLASVMGRFREFTRDNISQSSPQGLSVSTSKCAFLNASEFLPTDSSPEIHRLWPMESPRAPLKLKLSPQMTEKDPAEISTINSKVSFPAVQLKSPTVPHLPLKLRLLIPVPADPTFPSELSRPGSIVQLNSTTRAASPSSPQLKPSSSCYLDSPTSQLNASDSYLFAPLDSSVGIKSVLPSSQFYEPPIPEANNCISEVTTNGNAEILDALKEARDRVRCLEKKFGQSRSRNKSFGESIVKDCSSSSRSMEKHVPERTLRSEDQSRKNLKTWVLLDKSAKMDSISCKLRKKVHSRKRKCAQEESMKTDELKQSEQAALAGAFGQFYSQYENTTTTLVKDNSKLNYLMSDDDRFCYAFEQKFSDGMVRNYTEQENLMGSNLAKTSQFCESNLLPFQYPETNQLDSNCVLGKPLSEPEFSGGEQSYHQSSRGGRYKCSLKMEDISSETWKQEASTDQSLEELLLETSWLEGSMVSQEQSLLTNVVNPTANPSMPTHLMEFNHETNEYGCGNTGILGQEEEHNHMDTMPEELSSLLEFFPTTIHTPVWYNNNNNEFNRSEAYKLNQNFSLNQD